MTDPFISNLLNGKAVEDADFKRFFYELYARVRYLENQLFGTNPSTDVLYGPYTSQNIRQLALNHDSLLTMANFKNTLLIPAIMRSTALSRPYRMYRGMMVAREDGGVYTSSPVYKILSWPNPSFETRTPQNFNFGPGTITVTLNYSNPQYYATITNNTNTANGGLYPQAYEIGQIRAFQNDALIGSASNAYTPTYEKAKIILTSGDLISDSTPSSGAATSKINPGSSMVVGYAFNNVSNVKTDITNHVVEIEVLWEIPVQSQFTLVE